MLRSCRRSASEAEVVKAQIAIHRNQGMASNQPDLQRALRPVPSYERAVREVSQNHCQGVAARRSSEAEDLRAQRLLRTGEIAGDGHLLRCFHLCALHSRVRDQCVDALPPGGAVLTKRLHFCVVMDGKSISGTRRQQEKVSNSHGKRLSKKPTWLLQRVVTAPSTRLFRV